MPKMTVTKKFEFSYAHFLPEYSGKCKHMHGHNAVLEVEVSGPPIGIGKVYDTMVVDFGDLKDLVRIEILDVLDHKLLNEILEIPTAESMVIWIWERLQIVFGEELQRVRVFETSDSYAEIKR